MEVNVFPLEWGVSAGEVTFQIDPLVAEVIDITPGTLLGADPLVGVRRTDASAGTATLALARVGPTRPPTLPGTFATIELRIQETAPAGTVPLTITARFTHERFAEISPIVTRPSSLTVQP